MSYQSFKFEVEEGVAHLTFNQPERGHPIDLDFATELSRIANECGETPAVRCVLIDASGKSLYTYDRDVAYSGKSLCVETCTQTWRPFLAAPGARRTGEFALIIRPDGERQWAYRGKPLYRFGRDSNPGDASGLA